MSGNGQPEPAVLQGGVQAAGKGSNLVSQLLGLNQDHQGANGSFGGGAGQIPGTAGSKSKFNSASRLKLSDALHGINVTPNFLFLCLFMGFVAWLYVVYFIRHHEPLANSVLGTGAAHSATTESDRRLIANIKRTLPVRTTDATDFYVPIPEGDGRISSSGDYGYHSGSAAYGYAPAANMPLPSPPLPQPPSPTPPAPTPLTYYPYAAPQRDAYLMPVQQPTGTRVKMIVNR
jgi:hypothetical protein